MISSIKVSNIGPIKEQIELDFSYYSYINRKYLAEIQEGKNPSWLDSECQVDKESRLSIIKGLMGMNGTGKTTIVSFLKLINSITQDYTSDLSWFIHTNGSDEDNKKALQVGEMDWFFEIINKKTNKAISRPKDIDVKFIIKKMQKYAEKFVESATDFLPNGASLEIKSYDGKIVKLEKAGNDLHFKFKDVGAYSKSTSLYKLIEKAQEEHINKYVNDFYEAKVKSRKNGDFIEIEELDDEYDEWDPEIQKLEEDFYIPFDYLKLRVGEAIEEALPFTRLFDVIDVVDRRLDVDTRLTTSNNENIAIKLKINDIFKKYVQAFGQERALSILKTIDPKIENLVKCSEILHWRDRDLNLDYYIQVGENDYIPPTALSSGTKQVLMMLTTIYKAFSSREGKLVVIDELTNGIQYRIVEMMINLFKDPQVNVNKSQLLFTTHNIDFVANKVIDQKNYIILRRMFKTDNEGNIIPGSGDVEPISLYDFLLQNSKTGRTSVNHDRGLLSYMDHFNSFDGEHEESKYIKGTINPFFIPAKNIQTWKEHFINKKRPK